MLKIKNLVDCGELDHMAMSEVSGGQELHKQWINVFPIDWSNLSDAESSEIHSGRRTYAMRIKTWNVSSL